MAKYEIEYEVIGHHYKTIEVPDEGIFADDLTWIEHDHVCEKYHEDPIEECIITNVSKVEERK